MRLKYDQKQKITRSQSKKLIKLNPKSVHVSLALLKSKLNSFKNAK